MTKRTKLLSLFLSLCLIFSALTLPLPTAAMEIIDSGITTQPIKILTEDDVPFALDFQTMRQAGHVDRLATQETLLNEVLFENSDGSLTAYYFGMPVKYVDADGIVKDKNNTIVQRNDMKYTTAANDVKAVLPQNISEGISLEYNNYVIKCTPYVNSNTSVMSGESLTAASALATLNTAKAKEHKVEYNQVFDNKTSIVYTPTFSGVKEDIILTEYTGNVFRFRLETDGLVPQVQADGSVLLKTENDEAVFEISPIVLVDANGKICLNNEISLSHISGDAYLYTITANESFLTDEGTAYPVAVDPSFTIIYDCEDGIDSYTLCLGENSAYYQTEYLPAGITTDMYGIEIDEYRSFIQIPFMNSSFFSTNFQYATIEEVNLYLYASAAGAGTVSAHLVAPSTHTGTISDDFARYVRTPIQSISSTVAWGAYGIDITDEIMLWKDGTATWNYPEIMLKSTGMFYFCSPYYYYDYAPFITVQFYNTVQGITISESSQTIYLPKAGASQAIIYTLTPGIHINPTVYWTSSKPEVATVSETGTITAVGGGKCTITATTASGNHQATITVYVNEDIQPGVYLLRNAQTEKYMDVEGPSSSSGANIQQWELHTGKQVRWTLERNKDGYYTIQSIYSNLYIGVAGGSTESDARIQQFSWNSNAHSMQWFIYPTETNTFVLKPRSNLNMAIAVQSGGTANSVDLYQYAYTDDADDRDEWIFDIQMALLGVPQEIISGNNHHCIPSAITQLAAYYARYKGYTQFGLDTVADLSSKATQVQNAMQNAGGYGINENINFGLVLFEHTDNGITYTLSATYKWAGSFTWNDLITDLDAGYPVLLGFVSSEDVLTSPYSDPHMTVCVGYEIINGVRYVYLADAHNHNTHYARVKFDEAYNDFIAKVRIQEK